ncbi:MAG: 3-phosphoshikimate 1-carboxyvinyltransferase [Spirochaetia bacterium]|nr:3-phosphoshikimate 1-carboxyvinyltransferase [Spirochaetia bacterium]
MSKLKVEGSIVLQGDKSLSHRAAIFAALAKGKSKINNFLTAEDTINTLKAAQKLGASVSGDIESGKFEILSEGMNSFLSPREVIDAGNSGTGARLLLGLFSGLKDITAVIDGDESLRKRPMKRITEPLTLFNAYFNPMDKLPITVEGKKLNPIIYKETLGSAQVKSALMLAAIASQIDFELEEIHPSRDHTENMLESAGITVSRKQNKISMHPPYELKPQTYDIWSDISSAAFFVVLGLLANEGEIKIKNVLFNPFRDKYIDILKQMGGNIEKIVKEKKCGELGGDIIVRPSRLRGITIDKKDIPSVIDELPILTIAGLFAEGTFEFRGAEELRVKESDRISAMVVNLKNLNVNVTEYPDGLSLKGDPDAVLKGSVESFMDHRIIMSFAVAREKSYVNNNLKENKETMLNIKDINWIHTSFPDFFNILNKTVKYYD